ncbi:MAG: alpha/beta fold hydrolase [Candidatus Binatia bacterium]
MISESIFRFRAGDVELDGRISIPPGAAQGCVICHPHPLYGGDMNNSVVVAVAGALAAAGVATLRFDFRGVGRSGGSHGGGAPEVEDARAAVDALAAATGLTSVAIAGYSFGSLIALRVAAAGAGVAATAAGIPMAGVAAAAAGIPMAGVAAAAAGNPLAGVAAIAPPLAMFDASFVRRLSVPLLLLSGDRDAYCPKADFEALTVPAGATVMLLADADHFFVSSEREVADAVVRWSEGLAG